MNFVMNLITRVKNILLRPDEEWPAIDRESGDADLSVHALCRDPGARFRRLPESSAAS